MFNITEKTKPVYSSDNITSINIVTSNATVSSSNIMNLNRGFNVSTNSNVLPENQTVISRNNIDNNRINTVNNAINHKMPNLQKVINKGMKIPVSTNSGIIYVGLGWNEKNPQCDVDISAFLIDENHKILSDDWLVFYGNKKSPDGSTIYNENSIKYRKEFEINLKKINPAVKRIVFVMTIDEALNKHLNFSMLKDTYIQLSSDGQEIASFLVQEYYNNIFSMMLGEIYLHNGVWKFNAIGNGIAKDLAGLCEFYGVEVE